METDQNDKNDSDNLGYAEPECVQKIWHSIILKVNL